MQLLNSSPLSSGTSQQSVHSSGTGVVAGFGEGPGGSDGVVDGGPVPGQQNVIINHQYCCMEHILRLGKSSHTLNRHKK